MKLKFIRWPLIIGFVLAGLHLGGCNTTQPKTKTHTIGVIILIPQFEPALEGIKSSLEEMGYVEGENITFLYNGPLGSLDKVETAAQHLVEENVDVIISISTPPTRIVQQATAGTDIPVVFGATDPVGAGLVQSITHPGKNLTGIATGLAEDLRLEWLVRVAPNAKRIYAPYNPEDDSAVFALEMATSAAAKLDIELVSPEVRTPDEVTAAIENIPENVDAIFLLPDSLVTAALDGWDEAAEKYKLPMSGAGFPPGEKIVVSYGFTLFDAGRQIGRLSAQVLQGAKPADLPVETVEFFLGINLPAAEAIGLDIPDEILQAADRVIR